MALSLVKVLMIVTVAVALLFVMFPGNALAVLGYGALALGGFMAGLVLLSFIGQLLIDISDPEWRADFAGQLAALQANMQARRAFLRRPILHEGVVPNIEEQKRRGEKRPRGKGERRAAMSTAMTIVRSASTRSRPRQHVARIESPAANRMCREFIPSARFF